MKIKSLIITATFFTFRHTAQLKIKNLSLMKTRFRFYADFRAYLL